MSLTNTKCQRTIAVAFMVSIYQATNRRIDTNVRRIGAYMCWMCLLLHFSVSWMRSRCTCVYARPGTAAPSRRTQVLQQRQPFNSAGPRTTPSPPTSALQPPPAARRILPSERGKTPRPRGKTPRTLSHATDSFVSWPLNHSDVCTTTRTWVPWTKTATLLSRAKTYQRHRRSAQPVSGAQV